MFLITAGYVILAFAVALRQWQTPSLLHNIDTTSIHGRCIPPVQLLSGLPAHPNTRITHCVAWVVLCVSLGLVSFALIRRPFPVRDTRRRRLTVGEVKTYRDIALTKGHAGKGLKRAKDAFSLGAVEAARLADIMRQVRVP